MVDALARVSCVVLEEAAKAGMQVKCAQDRGDREGTWEGQSRGVKQTPDGLCNATNALTDGDWLHADCEGGACDDLAGGHL